MLEEMTPLALLGLHDPHIRIEPRFARQIGLDIGFRRGLRLERGAECAVGGLRLIERRLRGRAIEIGRAVEPVDLDEDRARLLRAAPADRREHALDLATADVGRDPDCGFQPHRGLLLPLRASAALDGPLIDATLSSGEPRCKRLRALSRENGRPDWRARVSASKTPVGLSWP